MISNLRSSVSETMDIANNLIFEEEPNTNLTNHKLGKLFRIDISETHFLFNRDIVDQTYGVEIGFPLALIIDSLFMDFYDVGQKKLRL